MLVRSAGIGLVRAGRSWWGIGDYLVIGCFCRGSNGWCRLAATLEKISESWSIATIWESPILKIDVLVLGSAGHGPTRAPQWWYFPRNNCKEEDYCAEKINTVWITLPSCFSNVYKLTPIVLHGRTEIPSSQSMYCPNFSHCWFLICNNFRTRRGQRSVIVVEFSV